MKSMIDLVKLRTSKRSYNQKPLDPAIKSKLLDYIPQCKTNLPFNSKLEFTLFDNQELSNQEVIGSYGLISGVNTYIAGKMESSPKSLEDFGYAMEKIILYATDLGQGTCWLAGSFKREEFINKLHVKENELIPAVTPVGGTKDDFKHKAVRLIVGAKNRKPWNQLFFINDFSKSISKEEAGVYEIPLEMVRLAPSASNKQPWRILKIKNQYHFYLLHTKMYQSFIKILHFDIQKLDMGIAMCHFELALKEIKLDGEWSLNDPKINAPSDMEYIVSWKIKGAK